MSEEPVRDGEARRVLSRIPVQSIQVQVQVQGSKPAEPGRFGKCHGRGELTSSCCFVCEKWQAGKMGFWSGRRIGILTSVDKSSTQPDIKARVFPSANAGEM